MNSPWFTLEAVPGLLAVESDWKRMIGPSFEAFKALCLEPSSFQVRSVRCPRVCGCDHRVVAGHDGVGALGVCRCEPPVCPDIPLSSADLTALKVNQARLGRALCKAFGFAVRHAVLPSPNTFQFGAWSSDAVPAILTIQVQNSVFRRVVAELVANLRRSFILFAPTSDFFDAPSQSILENHGAAFFGLDSHVTLTDQGTLHATRPPGELFARFTPQPKDIDLDVAIRACALVHALDTDKPLKRPSVLTVFRHYCIDELSYARIAGKYECSRPTIVRRMALIRKKTGLGPEQLRRLSPHIAKLEDAARDSRAAHIRPQAMGESEDDLED
jgi:hypothetical protein